MRPRERAHVSADQLSRPYLLWQLDLLPSRIDYARFIFRPWRDVDVARVIPSVGFFSGLAERRDQLFAVEVGAPFILRGSPDGSLQRLEGGVLLLVLIEDQRAGVDGIGAFGPRARGESVDKTKSCIGCIEVRHV